MKHSIIILLFLLSIEWTYAKCASGGFKFYPQQRHISMNSLFIVEGYGNNQKQILEFHKTKLYLLSEHGELIELAPQNIQKGQMLLMQAVFKPCTTLQPNTKYFLKNPDNASGFFTQWNPDTKNLEKVHWITGDSAVCALLATGLKIEFEKTKVNYYGCGPAANAIFNIKTTSDTEIWYKTEVVNMTNNRTTT